MLLAERASLSNNDSAAADPAADAWLDAAHIKHHNVSSAVHSGNHLFVVATTTGGELELLNGHM